MAGRRSASPRTVAAFVEKASYGGRTVDSVIRGGSWNNNNDNAACVYRNNNNPDNRNNNVGFRCAKTLLASAGCFAAEEARRPRSKERDRARS